MWKANQPSATICRLFSIDDASYCFLRLSCWHGLCLGLLEHLQELLLHLLKNVLVLDNFCCVSCLMTHAGHNRYTKRIPVLQVCSSKAVCCAVPSLSTFTETSVPLPGQLAAEAKWVSPVSNAGMRACVSWQPGKQARDSSSVCS